MKTEIIGLQGQRPSPERGREPATKERKSANPAQLYSKIVERYALLFDRPEVRLRFLNNTLAKQAQRQEQLQQSIRRFKFLDRIKFYDWVLEARFYSAILEELKALAPFVPSNKQHILHNVQVPLSARAFFFFYQSRHAFYAMAVLVAGLMLFGLYSLATWSARHVNGVLAQRYQRGGTKQIVVTTAGQGTGTAFAATGAKYLPGYQPEKVWRVDDGGANAAVERYSNGARIQTQFETDNHPRGYYLIPRGSESAGDQLRHEPIGIVYHTSEGVMVDFVPDNNATIQKRSQGLIEYVRRIKAYNYLIDRYGETYRIVRDDHAAHHAGRSIWADTKHTYVGLNESFLGICFESTSTAGSLEDTLTEAQIVAGRALTNVLRSKYNLDDANCTTHGLVSVNPDKMLIAFHHDWVRNFPFEAMGLSDKYKILPPSMLDYGFTYDEDILEKLGRVLWPGALAADEEFKRRAERSRANIEMMRRKLLDRYSAQMDKARKLRAPTDETGKSSLAAQSTTTDSAAESSKE